MYPRVLSGPGGCPTNPKGQYSTLNMYVSLRKIQIPSLLPHCRPIVHRLHHLHHVPRLQPVRAEGDGPCLHPIIALFDGDVGLPLLSTGGLAVGEELYVDRSLQVMRPTECLRRDGEWDEVVKV